MQVDKPQIDPVALKSHDGEVTAVTWYVLQEHSISKFFIPSEFFNIQSTFVNYFLRSPSETGKVATCSDDFTVSLIKMLHS